MKVFHGRADRAQSQQRTDNFTGTVWADPVMPTTDDVTINTVFFAPCARTYWHTHERGQVLHVTAGQGWICVAGNSPKAIRQGDIVWIGPGERHWHGGTASSYMVHVAISIGKTAWQEEVAERDYPAETTGASRTAAP